MDFLLPDWLELVGVFLTAVTLIVMLREKRARESEQLPVISLTLAEHHSRGWHSCRVVVVNRTHSSLVVERALAKWPGGIVLGRRNELFDQEPRGDSFSDAIEPNWHLEPGPGRVLVPERLIFVKRTRRQFWKRRQAVKLKFDVTMLDSNHSNRTVWATTNKIHW